jgi:hypothetical protein
LTPDTRVAVISSKTFAGDELLGDKAGDGFFLALDFGRHCCPEELDKRLECGSL